MKKLTIVRHCISRTHQVLMLMQPSFKNFPKEERQVTVTLLISTFTKIIASLNLAIQVKSLRLKYLQEAQASLQTLIALVHYCKDAKYISLGFFEDIDLRLTSIGTDLISVFRSYAKTSLPR